MKCTRYGCVVFSVFFFSFSVLNSYTNKTYLRPIDSSILMESEFNFAHLMAKQNRHVDFLSSVDISVFGWQSVNESKMGKTKGCC